MEKITINLIFDQWGHGSINVIPTNYKQWDLTESGIATYNLDSGSYTILYDVVTGNGGKIVVTKNGGYLAEDVLSEGIYSGHFRITI